MDDKTFEYMKKRVEEATRLKRSISDLHHKRKVAADETSTVCGRDSSLRYYDLSLPFPIAARALVVATIDERIKELEDKLAEL